MITCGRPWPAPSQTQPRQFGGKEHDTETGLDYFGARYLEAQVGRFITADETSYADPADPQSWNRYTYTLNNPFRYIDFAGHFAECPEGPNRSDFCSGVTDTMPVDPTRFFWEAFFRESWRLAPTPRLEDHGTRILASRMRCFSDNYMFDLRATNRFFFHGPGRLARTAISTVTAGAMARSTGLTTLGMAARDLLRGQGVANLGFRGTLISIGANSMMNALAAGTALELGIIVGAGLDSAYHTLTRCE